MFARIQPLLTISWLVWALCAPGGGAWAQTPPPVSFDGWRASPEPPPAGAQETSFPVLKQMLGIHGPQPQQQRPPCRPPTCAGSTYAQPQQQRPQVMPVAPQMLEHVKQIEADLAAAREDALAKGTLAEQLKERFVDATNQFDAKLKSVNAMVDGLDSKKRELESRIGEHVKTIEALNEKLATAAVDHPEVATGALALLKLIGFSAGPAGWIATVLLPLMGAGLAMPRTVSGLLNLPRAIFSRMGYLGPKALSVATSPIVVNAGGQFVPQAIGPGVAAQPASAAPIAPPGIKTDTQFVPVENNAVASALAWAMDQHGRKYPGDSAILTTLQSLINQKLNA